MNNKINSQTNKNKKLDKNSAVNIQEYIELICQVNLKIIKNAIFLLII